MITEAGRAAVGDIRRDDIEDYKVWLGRRLAATLLLPAAGRLARRGARGDPVREPRVQRGGCQARRQRRPS